MYLGTDGKELNYFKIEQQEEWICQNCIVSFDLLSDDGRWKNSFASMLQMLLCNNLGNEQFVLIFVEFLLYS